MVKRYRCKKCSGISYTGNFCSTCDQSIWKYLVRRKYHYIWVAWACLFVSGIILSFIFHYTWIGYGFFPASLGVALSRYLPIWNKRLFSVDSLSETNIQNPS